MRVSSFVEIFSKLAIDKTTTEHLARFRYGLLIGLKHIECDITPKRIKAAADLYKQLILKYVE